MHSLFNDVVVISKPQQFGLQESGNRSFQVSNQKLRFAEKSSDFDIVGISYYPYWHGTLAELSENMDNISERYNKKVVVVETAYANTLDNADQKTNAFTATEETAGGYKASQDGQYEFLTDLVDKIKDVKNNNGLGFFYWEPLWSMPHMCHLSMITK